ncbi:MAG: type II secretion system F family protein [Isosphaeraceae bacterium]
MTTDSAAHRSSDDALVVTETWEADPGPDARVAESSKLDEELQALSEIEALARVRSDPWTLQHMMGLVAAIAIAFWLVVTMGWLLLFVIIAMSFAMVVGLGFILARLRTSRQDALLRILAIAAEGGMPLSTAVAAFADQFRGKARRRAMNVIASLNAGSLLPAALEETPKAVSRDAVLMAWVGQDTGTLPQALRLAGASRSAQLSLWMATASRLAYLMGMIVAVQAIVFYLVYFIVPRLQAIFLDFGLRLPELTMWVLRISRNSTEYAPVSFLVGIAELVLLVYIPFSFVGWMNYNVPILDRLLTRRHAGLIMRALSLVIESSRPIGLGLSTLANHYPTRWVRRRLRRAEADVRLGTDWIDALWKVGLFRRTDAEVLGSAASVGNLPWALRELAETCERRQSIRIRVFLQTLFPMVVILIGLGVATLAVAYFLPLVSLIQRLADQ